MPWWAIAYLTILTLVVIISVIKDYYDSRGLGYIFGEILSGALGFIFIVSHWNQQLALNIGWYVVPLLLYVLAWDQYALSRMKPSAYPDLTDQENRDMDRYSKIFAVLFVSPCYVAGGLLTYRIVSF